MSRPHTQVTQENKTLERINGERGSCGCKKETVVDHLLPAEGRGEQAFHLSWFFSSSSSEIAITTASGAGRRWGRAAALGDSDSSLRQQDKEDSLEEVTKAANSSHKPVGAKAGVSIHHAFCDVCLMRREQRSERDMPRTTPATAADSPGPTTCGTVPPLLQHHFAMPSTATNACSDTSTHCKLLNQAQELCEIHFLHSASTRRSIPLSATPGERNATGRLSSIFHFE